MPCADVDVNGVQGSWQEDPLPFAVDGGVLNDNKKRKELLGAGRSVPEGIPTVRPPETPMAQQGSTHPRKAVPRPRREVAADFGLSCLQHGCDEQPPAPHELAVHGPGVGVLGEPGEGCGGVAQR